MKSSDLSTCSWVAKKTKGLRLSIAALVVCSVAAAVISVYYALATRNVIDSVSSAGTAVYFWRFCAVLIALVAAHLLLNFINKLLEERVRAKLDVSLKKTLVEKLLKADYSSVSAYHSGELMTRLTSDVTVVTDSAAALLPNVFSMVTRLVYAFIVLVALSPLFAFAFVGAGLLMVLISLAARPLMKSLHSKVQQAEGSSRSFIQEILGNILVVKTFSAEDEFVGRSAGLLGGFFSARIKKASIGAFANTAFSAVFQAGSLFAIIWGAYNLGNPAGAITFGTLTAILQLVGQIQLPMSGLSGLLPRFYALLASAERLIELENLPEEPVAEAALDAAGAYAALDKIVFDRVKFGYGRDAVLQDCSLEIGKGDFVVISGISGIGKSTLLKLLLGVFSPQSGEIFFEGGFGRIAASKSTRPLISYVPQGNLLLSGTVRENILFVTKAATDEQVLKAAEIACAREFIERLPNGLDTVIGEKGYGLSEGQVQRLAIARAILCGEPILLLDESTSALDENTEKQVLSNIKSLTDKTCIIISHKKAAFEICNRKIEIADKTIREVK